jgi:hypothetical protein
MRELRGQDRRGEEKVTLTVKAADSTFGTNNITTTLEIDGQQQG